MSPFQIFLYIQQAYHEQQVSHYAFVQVHCNRVQQQNINASLLRFCFSFIRHSMIQNTLSSTVSKEGESKILQIFSNCVSMCFFLLLPCFRALYSPSATSVFIFPPPNLFQPLMWNTFLSASMSCKKPISFKRAKLQYKMN